MTSDPRILQLVPAPPNMEAVYGTSEGSFFTEPVVALALVSLLDLTEPGHVDRFETVMGVVNTEEGFALAEDNLPVDCAFLGYRLPSDGRDWQGKAQHYKDTLASLRKDVRSAP